MYVNHFASASSISNAHGMTSCSRDHEHKSRDHVAYLSSSSNAAKGQSLLQNGPVSFRANLLSMREI